jgi:hypothetical protein
MLLLPNMKVTVTLSKKILISLIFLAVCGVAFIVYTPPSMRVYFIGNSLTADSEPTILKRNMLLLGKKIEIGYHIQCGRSIEYIVSKPQVCIPSPPPYGEYPHGLTQQIDVLSIQPYYDTLEGAFFSIKSIISQLSQKKTRILIYQGWPENKNSNKEVLSTTYQSDWDKQYSTLNRFNRDFYKHLITSLGDIYGEDKNISIELIPIGEVLYRLDVKLRKHPIDEINNVYFLYRDKDHLNLAGHYVAMATVFSVLLHRPPTYLLAPSDPITTQLLPMIRETIWEVVATQAK